MSTLRLIAAVSSLLMAAAPALAASDYLLQLDTVKGEATAATQSIEVESFSWGVSNAGAAAASSGGGSGKASMQDMSVMKARAPRDASSGMASGKRAAPEAAADGQAAAAPPKVGDVASFTVLIRESPTKSSTGKSGGCATGKHFSNAVLVARGQRYELADVVETSCTVADGKTRKEYTGHVTLMK
jgi:type VI secretion system secreted protein Hcp